MALAEEGKSVLFIDADLRHPSVAHKLGIEGHVGLSHVLSRQASPADVIQKYWKPNLHIMPAGKRPANASILLNSDLMKEMVEQALTQYDYVIIDTAPLSVASEATVFGRMAGGLVLVTGKGVVEKKELENTATALQAAEVPILASSSTSLIRRRYTRRTITTTITRTATSAALIRVPRARARRKPASNSLAFADRLAI